MIHFDRLFLIDDLSPLGALREMRFRRFVFLFERISYIFVRQRDWSWLPLKLNILYFIRVDYYFYFYFSPFVDEYFLTFEISGVEDIFYVKRDLNWKFNTKSEWSEWLICNLFNRNFSDLEWCIFRDFRV